jgi:nitroreductase
MDAFEAIKGRRSIRAFRPEPVDQAVLHEILEAARWSPSYKNSQPWEVVVVSGKRKEELSEMLIGLLRQARPFNPDLPHPQRWPERETKRIERLVSSRGAIRNLPQDEKEAQRLVQEANFSFYRAPHVLFLHQSKDLSMWSLFDLGLFAQTLMLSAYAKGVHSVPQAFVTLYAKEIKEFLEIPQSQRLIIGISMGYPDTSSPEYSFRSERDPVDTFVRWL